MEPIAKRDDRVTAVDQHLCQGSLTPAPFGGPLIEDLSPNVLAEHRPIALRDSVALNQPPHVPPAGKSFDVPPLNRGIVVGASSTVLANHRRVARNDDAVATCNDPEDAAVGHIVAGGTVLVG